MFNSGLRGKRAPDGYGTVTNQSQFIQQQDPQPSITGWIVSGLDDTALNIVGGQTVIVNGTGFASGAAVTVDGQTISPVTVISSTQLSFTAPAKSGGSYTLIVYNSTGGAAILVPGLVYSSVPTYSTAAGSIGTLYETTSINTSVVATSDSAITYSLASGSLPVGATLNANGTITGTSPVESGSTTYTFAIKAEDAELQDVTRTFTLTINTDVVTWSTPADNTTYTANVNQVASNVVLSATSAAGYGVVYTANSLPTGLSLTGNTISGTPTVVANSSTLLTATASTTNRLATRTINWIIQFPNDPYFNLTTLLLNGETSSNYWIQDVSTNKFALTVNGDARPAAFSPYETVWSIYFNGSSYITPTNNSGFYVGSNNATIECWIYPQSSGFIFNINDTDGSGSWWLQEALGYDSTNQWVYYSTNITNGSSTTYSMNSGSSSVPLNQWSHVAISKSGTTWYIFVNGVLKNSGTKSHWVSTGEQANATVRIGARGYLGYPEYYNGYISNFRHINGTALYTSSFTPSTTTLTAVTGTTILVCHLNTIKDSSSNNLTLTSGGSPTVSNFGPFIETDVTTGSGYFDGTGDYLNCSYLVSNVGTGNFTIELWIYNTVRTDYNVIFDSRSGATANPLVFGITSSGYLYYYTGTEYASTTVVPLNVWVHVALARSGSTIKIFQNGTEVLSRTDSSNLTGTSTALLTIGRAVQGVAHFFGYISNLRIIKGTAVYTANFTPPTSPLTSISGTSLLTLQNRFGETNNRFVDSSGLNYLITRNGNATQGTFSPFSQTGWSVYFDGTGDALYPPDSQAALTPGTSSTATYTIEGWFCLTGAHKNYNGLWDWRNTGFGGGYYLRLTSGGYVQLADSSVVWTDTANYINQNIWYHVAFTVVSNGTSNHTYNIYLNGQLIRTGTNSTNSSSGRLTIGSNTDRSTHTWQGYISNFRVVNGTAVYTSNFTPSTSPLTSISGTSLLTCQSNRFIDNSANNFTITRNGDVSVQSFSPFSPAIITPTTYSGYFDGTDDSLTLAANTAFDILNGSYTIEFWFYANSLASSGVIVSKYVDDFSPALGYYVSISSSNVSVYLNGITSRSYSFSTNTWYHVAISVASNVGTIYVNGQAQGSTFNAGTDNSTNKALAIGYRNGISPGLYFNGFISNLRIVKGTAVYTANFTPPTTPLTAISGTSLLTCQSNRFIDNSVNNFTITVNGNSIPSQFNPFGNTSLTLENAAYSVANVGGSMYFDGTGDYLSSSYTANWSTAGRYTFECWVYPTTLAGSGASWIATVGTGGTGNTIFYIYQNSAGNPNSIGVGINGTNEIRSSNNLVYAGSWYHIAFTYDGTTTRIYLNGIQVGSGTTAIYANSSGTFNIGGGSATANFTGYISNARLIRSSSVYTSNFALTSSPLSSVGAILLLNGTNSGIIDQTGKNILETVGDTKLSTAVTKFGNASMFFDGTGDYLRIPTSEPVNFGTGNFTIEFWTYFTEALGAEILLDTVASGYGGELAIRTDYIDSSRLVYVQVGGINFAGSYTSATVLLNNWRHWALVRSGTGSNNVKLYLDGTQIGQGTTTASIIIATNIVTIGGAPAPTAGYTNMTGYMEDFRITKGYARYTTNFTPHTTALIGY